MARASLAAQAASIEAIVVAASSAAHPTLAATAQRTRCDRFEAKRGCSARPQPTIRRRARALVIEGACFDESLDVLEDWDFMLQLGHSATFEFCPWLRSSGTRIRRLGRGARRALTPESDDPAS